jgi:hypothetical protein
MCTYSENVQEVFVVDGSALCLVERVHQLLGFFLTKIESEINKTPSEVVSIKLFSILLVNRFENFLKLIKSWARGLWNSVSDIADEIFDVELVQFFNRRRKLLTRSSLKVENILI